jgi:hypothetical protein
LDYVEDVNTSLAYTKTYHHLITNPAKQILLGVQFYMDGAVTGQFANLPVTAVQIAFTIFNCRAHEQDHFWGTLGFVPKYTKQISRGNQILLEAGHAESLFSQIQDEFEGNIGGKRSVQAQDLHNILHIILASYVDVQHTGFYWDLVYKGQMYKDIEFVLFTPNLWVDMDKADKLCGHYSSRTQNVANLC